MGNFRDKFKCHYFYFDKVKFLILNLFGERGIYKKYVIFKLIFFIQVSKLIF